MPTPHESLAVAIQHHKAGRLQAAEEIYRRILAAEPNQPDALNLLDVLAAQSAVVAVLAASHRWRKMLSCLDKRPRRGCGVHL